MILAVGLVAVTNLFVVAAASNQIGNLTTATATEASQTLERLKSVDFLTVLVPPGAPTNQGSLVADTGPANAVPSATTDVFVGGVPPLTYHMYRTIPSLGVIRTRWTIWSCTTCGPTEVHVHHRALRGHELPGRRPDDPLGVHELARLHCPGVPLVDARIKGETAMTATAPDRQAGFSLVELMIAMVITLIVTGAIYGLLSGGESAFRCSPRRPTSSRTAGAPWT